jgi:N-acetylglutamate synthase-like GNAT family acetyltransferase
MIDGQQLAFLILKGESSIMGAPHGSYQIDSTRGRFKLTNQPQLLQPHRIKELFAHAHWGADRTLDTIERSIKNSDCYGIYDLEKEGLQIALARVVTDDATFAYLCDVIVDQTYRGLGLSKWLLEGIMANPRIAELKRFLLVTRDAHELYRRFGFEALPTDRAPRFMEILNPNPNT